MSALDAGKAYIYGPAFTRLANVRRLGVTTTLLIVLCGPPLVSRKGMTTNWVALDVKRPVGDEVS